MPDLPALREAVAKVPDLVWLSESGTGWCDDAENAAIMAVLAAAPALLDELETLRQRVNEDNEVCLCGCPPDAHERYEEGGESCENETHTCLRVCRSVAAEFEASQKALAAERIENAHLRAAFVAMEKAANEHETDLAAARAVLETAKLHKREVTVLSSQVVVVVDRAAWQTWQAQETDHMAEVGKLVIPAMEREDA